MFNLGAMLVDGEDVPMIFCLKYFPDLWVTPEEVEGIEEGEGGSLLQQH